MNHVPTARNRERILEAIDQLRKRKARPDVTRICNYLFRRFHVSTLDAKADLEWCVTNNIVLKVEYKGSISYRNAAKKWAQMRHREAQGYNSNNPNALNKLTVSKNFMEMLTTVFGGLVMEEPDYLEVGVPPKEIIDNILSKDSVRYTRNYIAILLIKEVERGNLIKLENGNFLLGPCADDRRPEWMTKEAEQKFLPQVAKRNYSTSESVRADASDHVGAAIKPKKRMIAKMQQAQRLQEKLGRRDQDSGDEKPSGGSRSENGNVRLGGRRKVSIIFVGPFFFVMTFQLCYQITKHNRQMSYIRQLIGYTLLNKGTNLVMSSVKFSTTYKRITRTSLLFCVICF